MQDSQPKKKARVAAKHSTVVNANAFQSQKKRFNTFQEEIQFRTSINENPVIARFCAALQATPPGFVYSPATLVKIAVLCGFPPDTPVVSNMCFDVFSDPSHPDAIAYSFPYLEKRGELGYTVHSNFFIPY